ncbi:MAG: SRPBCC family protein [Desulfosarcina sp.]
MVNHSGSSNLSSRSGEGSSAEVVNVDDNERIISALLGAPLAIYGLSRATMGGLALTVVGGMLLHRGTSGYCPLYALSDGDRRPAQKESSVQIVEVMTIGRSRHDVYEAWRDLEKLPRFMHHIESVRRVDNRHSHWTAHLPIGMGTLSWEAEIKQERPDERIVWASLPDADIQNAGCVIFKDAPGERGTEIKVNINYRPPAGPLGRAAAALANPAFSKMIRNDIRRFKALMETGEIPTTEGQPTGK